MRNREREWDKWQSLQMKPKKTNYHQFCLKDLIIVIIMAFASMTSERSRSLSLALEFETISVEFDLTTTEGLFCCEPVSRCVHVTVVDGTNVLDIQNICNFGWHFTSIQLKRHVSISVYFINGHTRWNSLENCALLIVCAPVYQFMCVCVCMRCGTLWS